MSVPLRIQPRPDSFAVSWACPQWPIPILRVILSWTSKRSRRKGSKKFWNWNELGVIETRNEVERNVLLEGEPVGNIRMGFGKLKYK